MRPTVHFTHFRVCSRPLSVSAGSESQNLNYSQYSVCVLKSLSAIQKEMAITTDHIRGKLIEEIGATHVEVEDTTSNRCSTSFKVIVVSPQFEGKPLLQRHRMVNTCLATELKEIHAFEQKTFTPEQWEKQKQQ